MKELVEREHELTAIGELLDRRNGVIAVEAGMGFGKTSLVEAACRLAQELDYRVLSARGSEVEADFASGVVRQLFDRQLAKAASEERASLLIGPAAAAGRLLFGSPVDARQGDPVVGITGVSPS